MCPRCIVNVLPTPHPPRRVRRTFRYGVLKYASGVVYKGCWKGGVRHGHGELTFPGTGQTYKGEWYAGQRHGDGVHTSVETGIRFEGRYEDGRIRGHGSLVFTEIQGKEKGREKKRVSRGTW